MLEHEFNERIQRRPAGESGGWGGDGGALGEEAALAALVDHVCVAERNLAQAVVAAGELAGSGVAERVAGQPLELVLAVACRLTGADRKTLIAAGETLADLPVLKGLFVAGAVSWGQVRAITAAVKRLSRADRAVVDARVAATVDRHGGVESFEPDELVWAVDAAVDELRDPGQLHRQRDRASTASFLAVQSDLEGGVKAYGHWRDPGSCQRSCVRGVAGMVVIRGRGVLGRTPRTG